MPQISQNIIDEIREHTKISQVVGNYISLVKKGKSYHALCPFHSDHNPSLVVNDDKQIFKCFVCGEGGGVFQFVSKYKNCSYAQAILEVAKITNFNLDYNLYNFEEKTNSKYDAYYQVLEEMVVACHFLIGSEKYRTIIEYLNQRNIDQTLIDEFKIGFNPDAQLITKHLLEKGFEADILIKTGISNQSDLMLRDCFQNRIVFPIHDEFGHPIGFSGRSLDSNQAKYINTKDTEIFHKSNILFNLHRAKRAIQKADCVYLMEGVTDVMALYKIDYQHCVCGLGTALNETQLASLKKYTNNLILFYDGDQAGQNATLKAGILALKQGMNCLVVDNKSTLDPMEIYHKLNHKGLRDIAGKLISFLEFVFDYYDDGLNTYLKRKQYLEKVGPIIDLVHDETDRINFELILKEKTQLKRLTKTPKQDSKICYNNVSSYNDLSMNGLLKAEYNVLNQMMLSHLGCEDFRAHLGFLIDDNHLKIAQAILEHYRLYNSFDYARFIDELNNDTLRNIVSDILSQENLFQSYDKTLMNDCILIIKRELMKLEKAELMNKTKEFELLSDQEKEKILEKISEINKKLGGNYYGTKKDK